MSVGAQCFIKVAMYSSVGSARSWCPAQAQAGLNKWLGLLWQKAIPWKDEKFQKFLKNPSVQAPNRRRYSQTSLE